jgi:hypothetical protein
MDTADPVAVTKSLSLFKSHVDNQNFTVVSSVPGQSGVSLLHNGQSITLDNIHNLTSTVKVVQDGQSSINLEYGTNIQS